MFKEILNLSENGYYQSKNELIENAVNKYKEAKDGAIGDEKLSVIKNESEEILRNTMIENGFKDEDDAYISIDKEFFDNDGRFDSESFEKFQKEMVRYYAQEQLKWTFAGTTSLFTPTTKKIMADNGEGYANLLPVKLKKKYLKEQKERHLKNKDADFQLFLYTDGTISNKYDQEKAGFSMNKIKDDSGFDWTGVYSPGNKVQRKGWTAGFNKDGEWEKVETGQEMPKRNVSIDFGHFLKTF